MTPSLIFTFIFEAADDVGSGHCSVVICKAVIEFHHVLRRLLSDPPSSRGTQAGQVEGPQELLLQTLQQALHAHAVALLQQRWVHHTPVPVSQPWSRPMPVVRAGDGAAVSTERLQQQQDPKQQEQRLGAAGGSQLRVPNARHGKNNLQVFCFMPLRVKGNDCDPRAA